MSRMSRMSRSVATLGLIGAAGSLALAPSAQAATVTAAPKAPHMTISLSPSVKGQTLTYKYSESGAQYLVRGSESVVYDNEGSIAQRIYLDGKNIDGSDTGDVACTSKGLTAFKGSYGKKRVHLAKPGKHTLRVVASYCGTGGARTVSRTYTVTSTAPAKKTAASLTAAGPYTPGKPFALSAKCGSATAAKATVVGPRAMSAKLTRVGKTQRFTGSIAVPKTLQGSWVRLRVTCSDGSTATTIVSKVGAKRPAPTA